MTWPVQTTWFPLLRKELVEQSVRKRTYVSRSLFGCALVLVYLPMFACVSFWIGLTLRRRATAIIVALAVIVLWNVVPAVICMMLSESHALRMERAPGAFLWLLSPAAAVGLTETNSFRDVFAIDWALPMAVNIAWYLGIMYLVRAKCLKNADRYLGRSWSRYERNAESGMRNAEQ